MSLVLRIVICVAIGSLGALVTPLPVGAQGPARGRRPRVIQLEEIRIEGRVQKPNAFYILNRSNLGYEVLDLRTSFVDEIIESVEEAPF